MLPEDDRFRQGQMKQLFDEDGKEEEERVDRSNKEER